ncbi:MAG: hypothetical protein ACFFB3_08215 [Candidatus Hodarchaeota archaeon]
MSDSEFQDAITYFPEALRIIKDKKALKLLKDENLRLVLKFLRNNKQPMTVKELERAFKEKAKLKSDKTIYRYLNKLEKADLVVQAGKRIFTDEKKKIRTQTLYSRTAKIFLPDYSAEKAQSLTPEEKRMKNKALNAIATLVARQYGFSQNREDEDCLNELVIRILDRKSALMIEMVRASNEELDGLTSDLDIDEVNNILEKASIIALVCEKNEWNKELLKCFSNSSK